MHAVVHAASIVFHAEGIYGSTLGANTITTTTSVGAAAAITDVLSLLRDGSEVEKYFVRHVHCVLHACTKQFDVNFDDDD